MDTASVPVRPSPGARVQGTREAGAPLCLLALATSGEWCSVGVYRHRDGIGESDCLSERLGNAQSERILAMVREASANAGVALDRFDAVAFDAGPGAFTGLRIGCAVAQGLGLALGRPLIAIDAPAALAWQRVRGSSAPAAWVLVASDARIDELYVAMYRIEAVAHDAGSGGGCTFPLPLARPLIAPRVLPRQRFAEALEALWPGREVAAGEVLLAGNAWRRLGLLAEWAAHHGVAPVPAPGEDESYVRADALAELAHRSWCEGAVLAPAEASPRYVRDKIALDRDEQRALRERRTAGGGRP